MCISGGLGFGYVEEDLLRFCIRACWKVEGFCVKICKVFWGCGMIFNERLVPMRMAGLRCVYS